MLLPTLDAVLPLLVSSLAAIEPQEQEPGSYARTAEREQAGPLESVGPPPEGPADLVVLGHVFTGDPEKPRASLVAISGARIVGVGDRADLPNWKGTETRVIDNGDGSVLPGFNDAHCHFTVGYGMKYDVELYEAGSLEEILESVRTYAEANPDDDVITGQGWDLADMPGDNWPTASLIDGVCDDRPVLLWSEGPHGVWVNTMAMDMAGLFELRDRPLTLIERDEEGEPTGVLRGRGLLSMFPFSPLPDPVLLKAGIREGLREAASVGVTSVHESVSDFLLPFLAELHDAGELNVRFHVWGTTTPTPFGGGPDKHLTASEAFGREDWITFGTLKGGVDGMPGLRTSAMLAPYADDPSTKGMLTDSGKQLNRQVADLNARGLRVALHATGDAGVRAAAQAFAASGSPLRNRVEHAFVVSPSDIELLAGANTVLSVQPSFLAIDLEKDFFYERRFGKERCATVLPLRSLLDAGVTVAFGTDFSLTPIDPLVGLHAAVNRQTREHTPQGGWHPDQRITLAEAITAYTHGSAVAEGAESNKGRVMVGQLADLVLFEQDLFELPVERLLEAKVKRTIAGGKVVFP